MSHTESRSLDVLLDRLLVEQVAAWRTGDGTLAEDYFAMHPQLAASTEHAVTLVYGEYRLRRQVQAEPPEPADYLERFPDLAEDLRRQFEFAEAMQDALCGEMPDVVGMSSELGPAFPERIGRFVVQRELGRGSGGIVYLTYDPELGRPVALKIPHPEAVALPELRERFKREATAAAGLDHPNIVPVFEVGSEGPLLFIATAYIDGPNLAEWLAASGPADGRQAARLMISLCEAVEHAHGRGVLHRDIKSANVLLAQGNGMLLSPPSGSGVFCSAVVRQTDWQSVRPRKETPGPASLDGYIPKLADFGLAKALDAGGERTRTGSMMGTPSYMAPEQVEGRGEDITVRTDVWGLGAVLYELLTGRPPFEGDSTVRVLHRVVHDEPASPRRIRREIPLDLAAICMKCLEKSPGRRYASAADLAADLARYLKGRPTHARPVGRTAQLVRWAKRNPGIGTLGSVTGISLIALAAVGWWSAHSLRQALDVTNQHLFVADIRLAADALANHQVGQARERLARHIPQPGETDRRDFAWHYLWNQLDQEEVSLSGHGPVMDLEYSPDGSLLASAHESGEVVLHQVRPANMNDAVKHREHHARILQGQSAIVWDIDFSSDGRFLAGSAKDGRVVIWRTTDGRPVASFFAHEGSTESVSFSPDGKMLATVGGRYLRLWSNPPSEPIATLGPMPETVYSVGFSPDGKTVAVGGGNFVPGARGVVTLWDVETQRVHGELPHRTKVYCVLFAPDGKRLATGTQEGNVAVWDVASGKQHAAWQEHTNRIYDLAFSADGKRLASASKDLTVRVWDLDRRQVVRLVKGHTQRVCGVALAPSGRMATGGTGGLIKIWGAVIPPYTQTPLMLLTGMGRIAPGGELALFELGRGTAFSIDLERPVATPLPAFHTTIRSIGWSADGRWCVLAGERDLGSEALRSDFGAERGSVVQGDMEGDGDLDHLAAFGRWNHLVWQENLGHGRYAPPRLAATDLTDFPSGHVVRRESDNRLDVAFCRSGGGFVIVNPQHYALEGAGRAHEFLTGLAIPSSVWIQDVDNDGQVEFLIATSYGADVAYYKQSLVDGVPKPSGRFAIDEDVPGASDAIMTDIDGDGRADILVSARDADSVWWYRNLGSGRFSARRPFAEIAQPLLLDTADVDRDGWTDVLVAAEDRIVWHRNLGDGEFARPGAVLNSLEDTSWTRPLPQSLTVYDTARQRVVARHRLHAYDIHAVCVAPAGDRLATADGDHVIRIYSMPDCRFLRSIPSGDVEVQDLQFSPDGQKLLAAVGDNLRVWDAHDFRLLHDLAGHENTVWRMAFTADSSRVATVSDDLTVRLWSLAEGRQLHVLLGHQSSPDTLAFSRSGSRLVSADSSGAVRIWDTSTGQELLTLRDAKHNIRDIAFRDDRTVVALLSGPRAIHNETLLGVWRAE